MKAVTMIATGGPEVLVHGEIADPRVTEARDVLVRLRAAGVNPVDTKLRKRGTYHPERLPTILGCDGAGVVESVGSDVARFKPGDEVYFCHGGIGAAPGCYAQYTLVHEDYAALKPRAMSFQEAAALPLVLLTAWEALHDRAQVVEEDEVLIHAGAGGVGHVALQLARDAGARVCTTVSSDAKAEFAYAMGADLAINYRQQDFVAAVMKFTGDEGVDIALDTVGGATFARTFEAVRYYGDLVTLLQPDAGVDWKVARNRNLRVAFELMLTPMFRHLHAARLRQTRILEEGAALVDAGRLRVHLAAVLPLRDAAEAHRLLEAGGVQGKVVLEIA
jgi:NADPH2:quinone reductase